MEKRVQIAGEDMGIVAEQHLEVGREAGIREAADALVHQFCKDEILALLDKKPEVGT